MSPVKHALEFLVSTLFDLYTFVLILRFILQYLGINYYNPFTQFIIKATSPVITPVRRWVPGYKGIDFATLLVIFLFTLTKVTLSWFIARPVAPFFPGLLILALGEMIRLTINIYFFAVIIQIISSWVAPMSHSPILEILNRLTGPLMRPFKRWIPPMGGFDITPIPVIISLKLAEILFASTVIGFGLQIASIR
tara:strand:+ start:15099 stop:15680 length:582 start_codon:yes stop_codon:yes gene_type:complete